MSRSLKKGPFVDTSLLEKVEAMNEAEARGDAAVRYRGIMVDYAMLPRAHDVLREAERFGIQRPGAR